MKKVFLGLLIGLTLSGLFAFTAINFEPKKNTAEVEQIQGLYIFLKSKPVMEYEVIGSEKTTVALKGNPQELLNIALKKAKKDYQNAEGIIFTNEDMDRYDYIKFKN